MRCQKVRCYLSAFCRNELTGGERKAITAHLEVCPDCRREEAAYREIAVAINGLSGPQLSSDFNTKLLNRISAERYSEARNKPFFPRRVPLFGWSKLVPAVATICLLMAFILSGEMKNFIKSQENPSIAFEQTSDGLDNSYLTVQPESNHPLVLHQSAASGKSNWAFKKQLERANRIRGLMVDLAEPNSFAGYSENAHNGSIVPFGPNLFIELPFGGFNIQQSTSNVRMAGEVQESY
jgi:hypothetical protein